MRQHPVPAGPPEAQALQSLNDVIKTQQAFLNSCMDQTWIGDEERQAIRWLLSAMVDHRRRIRVAARVWRTLRPREPVAAALVAETAELIDEYRRFVPYVDRWRALIIDRNRAERGDLWRGLLELAQANLEAKMGAE